MNSGQPIGFHQYLYYVRHLIADVQGSIFTGLVGYLQEVKYGLLIYALYLTCQLC